MKRVLFQTARDAIGRANVNAKELRIFPVAAPTPPMQTTCAEQAQTIEATVCVLGAADAKGEARTVVFSAAAFR